VRGEEKGWRIDEGSYQVAVGSAADTLELAGQAMLNGAQFGA
jgi:hypothetical protein